MLYILPVLGGVMLKILFLTSAMFMFINCSPKFETTPNQKEIDKLEKAKAKPYYGVWIYQYQAQSLGFEIQLSIDEVSTKVITLCKSKSVGTTIASSAPTRVESGKLNFLEGITGTIKSGSEECGINFPQGNYNATVLGDSLTLSLPSGNITFSRLIKEQRECSGLFTLTPSFI